MTLKITLQVLLVAACCVGWALILARLLNPASWRWNRGRYSMRFDIHDDQRRIADNGRRAWLGMRR
jgi:hypothetical protein